MKLVATQQAVGHVLCHDMTQIIRGKSKGPRFHKGHVVTVDDIPVLLSMGKEHLYIWEQAEGMLHEDEAAERLRRICQNDHMTATPAKEGKIELIAACDGLFQVDADHLRALNNEDDIVIATRHTNSVVRKGEILAGMRVVPLVIEEKRLRAVCALAGSEPILALRPWKRKTCGLITTGSEVAQGRISDTFTPVIREKLTAFGIEVTEHHLPGDDSEAIVAAIHTCRTAGTDMILCTGGMSVDPDDRTPGAIRASGAEVISYGAPVLPGAMFLLGYFADGTPIMGLPGCVMYAKATIFDLVLPRVAADISISRADLRGFGHGGLCLNCVQCHFPNCSFGKGG